MSETSRHLSDRPIIAEGMAAGLLGAAVVALFYLGVDLARGIPFLTPSVLGEVVVLRHPHPVVTSADMTAVGAYTVVHVIAFVAFGLLLAGLVRRGETSSLARYGAFQALIIWSVLAANTLAGVVMAAWLWRRHPRLRSALTRSPFGAPEPATE
jgi:hypothetical protein